MTKEEAIEFGNMWLQINEDCKDSSTYEFFQMSIKALEQESCEDTISCEAVIDWLKAKDIIKLSFQEDTARKELKALSSVTPQKPRWIPVSEMLPEENRTVIASTKYGIYPEARYTKANGWEWAYETASPGFWMEIVCDVNAWMPLPKPYREVEE